MESVEEIEGITFKAYALKGHWKVLLHGYVIGYVARSWCDQPYYKLNLDGGWLKETYKNRMLATHAILLDLANRHKVIH